MFRKVTSLFSKWKEKEDSEENTRLHKTNQFPGSCTEKYCKQLWKEIANTLVWPYNIQKLEKQLEKCNKCFYKNYDNNTIVITRGFVSNKVHAYKNK